MFFYSSKLDRRRLEEAHFKFAVLKILKWYEMTVKIVFSSKNETLPKFLPIYQHAFHAKYSGIRSCYLHTHTIIQCTRLVGHRCQKSGCGTILVLDGNQKNNRTVCAAEDAGFIEFDGIPGSVKTGCMNTPEQKSLFCTLHRPRHVTLPSSSASLGYHGVIEVVLSKKTTRNNTFYEVALTCHNLYTASRL